MLNLPKRLVLLSIFFIIAPVTLGVSLSFLVNNRQAKSVAATSQPSSVFQPPSSLYAALPEVLGAVSYTIETSDARPIIIEKYLAKHNSPLLPYAEELLIASEKYDVDYQLIVAIAQCESNLCKKAPAGSFNCWGFENGATKFISWEQAIDQVAKTLRERYLDEGLVTPEEIMVRYAPPSLEIGGSWAKCVRQYIDELEYGEVE